MSNGSCQVEFAFDNLQTRANLVFNRLTHHTFSSVTCGSSFSRWCGGFDGFWQYLHLINSSKKESLKLKVERGWLVRYK
jgi:hypothetical protein